MADETRLLKVLRVASWPYRYPPLSWLTALISWCSATTSRFTVTMALCVVTVTLAVIFRG